MTTGTGRKLKRRRLGGRLLLAAASLLIVLGAGEIAVRIIDPPPHVLHHVNVAGYRLSSNPIRKYEYAPGRFKVTAGFDDHANFLINRYGFRDEQFQVAKNSKTFRILALGDSVTAGNGIGDVRNTYPKVLERVLNQKLPGRTFQVFNMGVGGYETLQEVESLRDVGLQFRPDLVTVGFVINDFDEDVDGGVYQNLLRQVGSAEREVMTEMMTRSSWRTWHYLLSRSRLLFFAYYRARNVTTKFRSKVFDYRHDVLQNRNPVERGLELLSKLQRENGFQVVIFLIPAFDWKEQVYRYTHIHEAVKKAAAAYPNMAVVDLRPACMAVERTGGGFAFDGLHPNERGHRLLGELMATDLMTLLSNGQLH